MNAPCQWPGRCPKAAEVSARIGGVGDRPLCREHYDLGVSMGMHIRDLGHEAFVPTWRQRASFRRDLTNVA